jgi:hypothetical protein
MNLVTPQNGQFMVAGYVVAAIVYLGYTGILIRRGREMNRRWRAAPRRATRPDIAPPPDAAA